MMRHFLWFNDSNLQRAFCSLRWSMQWAMVPCFILFLRNNSGVLIWVAYQGLVEAQFFNMGPNCSDISSVVGGWPGLLQMTNQILHKGEAVPLILFQVGNSDLFQPHWSIERNHIHQKRNVPSRTTMCPQISVQRISKTHTQKYEQPFLPIVHV